MPYNPFQRLIKTYKRFLVLFEKGLQQKDQEGGRGEGGGEVRAFGAGRKPGQEFGVG